MRFRFGDFVLDCGTRQLLRGGRELHVGPKELALLELLLRARPRAVSRTRLRAAVWPDAHVGETSLHVLVSQLRATLGDDAREPRFVRTLPGFGYAFPASAEDDGASEAGVGRRLWLEKDVSYAGKFTSFEHVTLEPKPVQPKGVPIWIASNNVEPGLKRVARLGDAWINNIKSPDIFAECWQKIRAYAADAGRDPSSIHASIYFTLAAGGKDAVMEGQTFLAQYYNRSYEAVANAMLCVTGTWDEVIDWMEKYVEAGAHTIVLRFAANDQLRTLEACAEALHRRGLLG